MKLVMRKSIRFSLFRLFLVGLVIVIVGGILLNNIFLEQYYVRKSKTMMRDLAEEVEQSIIVSKDYNMITELDRQAHISILIMNSELNPIKASYTQQGSYRTLLSDEVRRLIHESSHNIKEVPLYQLTDKDTDEAKLTYITQLDNGYFIVLFRPLKLIRESIGIVNEFYVLSGLCSMLIGGIVTFILSKKFTQAIIEMSKITKHISELKFDKRVVVESEDEIGQLGNSINILSYKLEASIQDLQEEIAFQKILSRDMSHELKTPVAVIKGYAQGIKYGVADSPKMIEDYLDIIDKECDRVDELVKKMLQLSTLSAKDYQLQYIEVFTSEKLEQEILESFEPIFKKYRIVFKCEIEPIMLSGDFTLIAQCVSNYISNAIKYGDKKEIIFRIFEQETFISLEVYNTGINIPENEKQRIFHSFYRIEKARSRAIEGHGLGLAIVKSIATLHHGSVGVTNGSHGVTFDLKLPK